MNFYYFFLILIFFILIYLIFRKEKKSEDTSYLMLQNEIKEIKKILDFKLNESNQLFSKHYNENLNIIKELIEKITRLEEGNKQVKSFAEQLKDLQDILKNPKQRGILGEYFLENILENVLPPKNFALQYKFSDGLKVDAVIFVKDKIIPIDAKFSLENYNRLIQEKNESEKKKLEELLKQDLKNRIEETAKYIKPEENTFDFAFMFIPSEALYYDLLINKVGSVNARDLVEYALVEKKVIIVSPTSFFAYLQTVLQGLKALQIEESAREIRKKVEDLARHLINYDSYMKKLGQHLTTTVNSYNLAYKELEKIDKDVYKITGKELEIEKLVLDKPEDFN